MSVIHIRHIKKALHDRFDGLIDLSDHLNLPAEQMEALFLSRALAAFVLAETAGSGITDEEAASSITDGGDDNGVDAVLYDLDNRTLFAVQSKWDSVGNGSPGLGDTQKFAQGIRDLINARFDRFNPKLRTHEAEILGALDDPNVTFDLILAHTGQSHIAEHAARTLGDLREELNDTTEIAVTRVFAQADIHAMVAGQVEGESITLEVVLQDWGHMDHPYDAYYGQIQAQDVAAWWADYGVRLLSKNLRKFIADSEVNESIMHSLLTDPEDVWYFNNGITVLAERILKKPIGGADRNSGSFVCEGVTVVNGAQTVGCIGQAAGKDPDAVARARVLIRFISLEDCPTEFAASVTRATNTQNRIERRDFVALDPEQERLRKELQLEMAKTYAIKTGEPDPQPDVGCSVVEATIALACSNDDPGLAVQAKREIGRLWEDIDKAPYRQIFNSGVSALQLWRAVEVLRTVDVHLKTAQASLHGRKRASAVHGNRLLLHLVFTHLSDESLLDPATDFDEIVSEIPGVVDRFLDALTPKIDELFGENSYLASLFKNASKCKQLVTSLLAKSHFESS